MKTIVCIVTNDLNYDQRMHRICTALHKAGYKVLLIGRAKNDSQPLVSQVFETKRLPCFFQKGKFFYLEYNFRLLFFLLFNAFDIVNAVDLDTILPAFIVARLRNKHIVYDAHEYFTEVPELVRRPATQKIWLMMEEWILPRLNHCYTVCQSIANLFEQKYHTKFAVIRNVPFSTQLVELPKNERYLIYQGALNEGRGLELLLQAMPLIDCKLMIAGEGDLSEQLRVMTKDLGLNAKVEFLGFVSPVVLKTITQGAYIGIGVSENLGLSYYYSLNNKCFDYIQAAVPAVLNNFPEYQYLNEQYNTALLCEPCAEDLAKTVNALLADDGLYNTLKNNCLKAREELNWETEQTKLLSVYAAL